jgi:purine-binding chemotaxis protein CheW
MEKQFVGFKAAQNYYCIDIADVKEVLQESSITKIPDSPAFVEGIMNLRNMVIPVISIRKKLGLTKKENPGMDKVIIVNIGSFLVGCQVDELEKVFTVDTSQILNSDKINKENSDFPAISEFIKLDQELYFILDAKKLLGLDEKAFIQKEIKE